MITMILHYQGKGPAARSFVHDMECSGIADAVRAEKGNLRYHYYIPFDDTTAVLLIDSWEDQAALDAHHAGPLMGKIAEIRDKYDLHMTAERYVSEDLPEKDRQFLRE